MITHHNTTDGRVEVVFRVDRTEADTVVISRETRTTPVTGRGTKWSKTTTTEDVLFEVEADLVPDLLKALATGLMIEKEQSA